jgi:phospholipid/cholesterol/gamma-HCH transport system permease protein
VSDMLLEGKTEGERLKLAGAGAWIAENAHRLESEIDGETKRSGKLKRVDIDMAGVERLDTFGAWLLERLIRAFSARGCDTKVTGLREDYRALMEELHAVKPEAAPVHHTGGQNITYALASIGHSIVSVGHWRAVPIVLLITFLIGCIISQQGIFPFPQIRRRYLRRRHARRAGAARIGVLLVCDHGGGPLRQRLHRRTRLDENARGDRRAATMGFDPIEVLILPRMLALIIALPILAFLGSMAALYGGGLVAGSMAASIPKHSCSRLRDAISIDHFRSA